MILTNRINREQFDEILDLYYQYDYEPQFDNFITYRSVTKDKRVVGFAGARTIVEGILLVDKALSVREKVEATKLLLEETDLIKSHNSIHAFTNDEKFIKILKKHFGFNERQKSLFMRLTNG